MAQQVAIGHRDTFGRMAYLSLADELSALPRFIEDEADEVFVAAARAVAPEGGVPWPPVGDVDIAVRQVRIAEGMAR